MRSEKTKRLISKANSGRKMSAENIEKNRQSHLGLKLPEEQKQKISASLKKYHKQKERL